MHFTTTDGRALSVYLSHTKVNVNGADRRCTDICLTSTTRSGHPLVIHVRSVHSPSDGTFCKRTGRVIARERFLDKFYTDNMAQDYKGFTSACDEFDREDRKKIFMIVFPEYHRLTKRETDPTPPTIEAKVVKFKPVPNGLSVTAKSVRMKANKPNHVGA